MKNKIVRLRTPPAPTLSDPHAQVRWIFFQIEAEHNEPRASSFRYARNKYIEYLDETNAYYEDLAINRRVYLARYWEADALIRFNKWLSKQELASKTRYSLYKSVRQAMDMAYALRVIDSIVYHAPIFKGVPETKVRAAYTRREQEIINAAVAKWIDLANNVLLGYTPTGQGIPYRRRINLLPLNIDGKIYTVSEAAEEFSISPALINKRIRQGWTARQAVGLDMSPAKSSINWVLNGTIYQSAVAVAQAFGVTTSIIHYRIKRGWTPEQIVGLTPPPEKNSQNREKIGTPIVITGQKFNTVKEASQHYGLNYSIVKNRLFLGWTLYEALEVDSREANGKKLTVEGVEYKSITTAATAYGLDHGIVANRLRHGYTPEQAVGIEPINVPRSDERAILWCFENIYGCDAAAMRDDLNQRNRSGFNFCTEKRLLKLFSRWGVWPSIDDRLIMPLAVEMGMLTGLNVESLKTLEIDSYQPEHRLTGQPVINFRKRRAGSTTRSEDRELHLPLLELEELYLDEPVAMKVHRLVLLILALTSKIRAEAPTDLSHRLFIFEDVELSRKNKQRVIVGLDPRGKASSWYKRFCREEGLYDLFGEKFNFNIARCRPTMATNMVLAGAELFQVQAALGHENIQTTATYLDEQQLRPVFNKTMSEALEQIAHRSIEFQKHRQVLDSATGMCNESRKLEFHETLSGCGCTNPYNPSETIRSITKFKEGSVCKYWNMCLRCDSAVITEHSLPKLIVYRNRVSAALEEDSYAIKARRSLYQDVLKLIDGILAVDVIFPALVIETARRIAATLDDLLVDQLIYQGV
ncbi:tyrosine-type recombinase/integrase [Chromobacterium sp. Rain0013]|uniref:tyrosine-type recombinase/integrase n=2 Tax=Chromobacterium TaxID=535 RepID=UPI001886DEAE|nr:tyrosine-type recombinase/integrase [Chromobacterium sp. Rain0013]